MCKCVSVCMPHACMCVCMYVQNIQFVYCSCRCCWLRCHLAPALARPGSRFKRRRWRRCQRQYWRQRRRRRRKRWRRRHGRQQRQRRQWRQSRGSMRQWRWQMWSVTKSACPESDCACVCVCDGCKTKHCSSNLCHCLHPTCVHDVILGC